jgi:hypothetical protein
MTKNMKRLFAMMAVLTGVSGVVLASSWVLDPKIAPTVALPDACRLAVTTLGPATNQFHCPAAEFVGTYRPPGSWRFSFYNTNGALKTVLAYPDGKTHAYDGPPVFD